MENRPLNVLIAEDEDLQAYGIKTLLTNLKHHVVGVARDGEEAVSLAKDLSPDLILMDIKMPKLDGIEAARKILKERSIPIIILTAYGDEDLVDRATRAGVVGYLMKPVEEKDLGPAIRLAYHLRGEIRGLQEQVSDLRKALRDRKTIERAKGFLMDHLQLKEEEAMRFLQKESRRQNRKLVEVAEAFLMIREMIPK